SRSVANANDGPELRAVFEEALRQILPIECVRLRDARDRSAPRHAPHAFTESTVHEVPGVGRGGWLETSFRPGSRPGAWESQVLGAAAHLGALVLEIERTRARLSRTGPSPAGRFKRDGAAPL